jgi:hypothetical protein
MSAVVSRRSSSPILAAMVALALLAVAALPVSAAAWSQPLRLAGPGTYWASNVASEHNNVVVSWLANSSSLVYRVSSDKGRSFAPPVNLGSANPGSVTLCGGFVAAVRVNSGAGTVKLDLRSIDGTLSATRMLASGRDLSLTGNGVTCVAGRRVATFWDEWIAGELHLKVAVVPVFESLQSYEFDLGVAHLHRVRGITASDTRIWVAWSRDVGIIVQRLNVASGPAMKVTKGSRVRIARNTVAPGVGIAAVGNRVYIGYGHDDDAFIRISNDGGRTFSRARTLYDSTAADPVDFFGLTARENVVVANIHLGPWCGGCVGSNMAVYSTNWGRTWASGPENGGGYMGAIALVGSGPQMRIAQAWDNRTAHETYGNPGYIKFRLGTP